MPLCLRVSPLHWCVTGQRLEGPAERVAAATFAVRGFPLAAYSNEPWEYPEARQRQEFLQKLAETQ